MLERHPDMPNRRRKKKTSDFPLALIVACCLFSDSYITFSLQWSKRDGFGVITYRREDLIKINMKCLLPNLKINQPQISKEKSHE